MRRLLILALLPIVGAACSLQTDGNPPAAEQAVPTTTTAEVEPAPTTAPPPSTSTTLSTYCPTTTLPAGWTIVCLPRVPRNHVPGWADEVQAVTDPAPRTVTLALRPFDYDYVADNLLAHEVHHVLCFERGGTVGHGPLDEPLCDGAP
jgi:hypothetical protein